MMDCEVVILQQWVAMPVRSMQLNGSNKLNELNQSCQSWQWLLIILTDCVQLIDTSDMDASFGVVESDHCLILSMWSNGLLQNWTCSSWIKYWIEYWIDIYTQPQLQPQLQSAQSEY